MIRPVSDLRNNFADISRTVHETQQPVFLTKNGFGDMVVLSMECYDELRLDSEIYLKLAESERSESEQKRYTLSEARETLGEMLRG
ncbi:MAG: prevent-host-death protein [Bacillota bacterium]|uniref:Antitoxin n=1 Tax=Candidatus Gallimonas intestinavium TaxID=2838603 RepID=A0A9D2K037_9FIRM|nr:MAG: prevent-host-death protein [Bacillota bacterium]HIZ72878.1 type II toxin-antitoxin system Phd/YefM family antitoxin [Candidatus Gallimonas intestinavium]